MQPLFLCQVSLTILSATGLIKADIIGSSDPYAVVLVKGREVGRTRTLFRTRDPVWSEPKETFPLRVTGSTDDCDVVVQLWDEDLGESSLAGERETVERLSGDHEVFHRL